MNNNDHRSSSLNEYTVKAKIAAKITSIAQKNQFLKTRLSNKQAEINETQIINNLNDVSVLLSHVSSLLSQLKSIIADSKDEERLQLVYQLQMNQFKKEQSDFIANQAAFDRLVASIDTVIPNGSDNKDEAICDSPNEDDAKFAMHSANSQEQIDDIYQKTVAINQISRDINAISHGNESKMESIESNLFQMKVTTHKANQEIVKNCNKKATKINAKMCTTLLICLCCVFGVLVYKQFINKL